jgi:hypothetical protein
MLFVSFKIKNTTNSKPGSPIPLDALFFILYFLYKVTIFFNID